MTFSDIFCQIAYKIARKVNPPFPLPMSEFRDPPPPLTPTKSELYTAGLQVEDLTMGVTGQALSVTGVHAQSIHNIVGDTGSGLAGISGLGAATGGAIDIVSGVSSGNKQQIAQGVEELARSAVSVAGLVMKSIPDVSSIVNLSGATSFAGVTGLVNVAQLIIAIQSAYRLYGRRVASYTLICIIAANYEYNEKELHSGWLESSAEHKKSLFIANSGSEILSLVGYAKFIVYKYRPDFFTEAKSLIFSIGLPMLGIAVSIMSILIATSVASFGIVPLVLGGAAIVAGLGLTTYKLGKYIQSREALRTLISQELISTRDVDNMKVLYGASFHGFFGFSLGDYFRHKIAEEIAFFSGSLIDSDEHDRRFYLGRMSDNGTVVEYGATINWLIINGMWEIIKSDIKEEDWRNALLQNPLFGGRYREYPRERVKAIFKLIKKNK